MNANNHESRPHATASGWRLKFGPTVYGPLFASEEDAAGFALYVANKYGLDPRCQSDAAAGVFGGRVAEQLGKAT